MKKLWITIAVLAAVLLGQATLSQTTLTSLRLTDTIKQGVGTVSLLKDVNASALEAFRTDNANQLVFAVDINENASGLETAKSQGVAVQSVSLVVSFPGGSTKTYTQFSTQTQAWITSEGTSVRQEYYTLLGDSGSSRITDNGKIGNQYFDSTIKVAVPDNLSTATSAVLRVQLLSTNPALGDPENFYDFTGGFEDLAIVTSVTAKYFDEVLPVPAESTFRAEAPAVELSPEGEATQQALLAVATDSTTPSDQQILSASTPLSWILKPGASSYNIMAYEDLYPSKGDYDFNDAVVAYRYQLGVNTSGLVERIEGVAYLVARGSNYTHNWTLDIPLPAGASATAPTCATQDAAKAPVACSISAGNGKLQWNAFSATRTILPVTDTRPQRNTLPGVAPIQGPKSVFSVSFTTPVALADIGLDDPWLYVIDTQQTIRPASSRDANGFPFALAMPSEWRVPNEGVDMGLAYPEFSTFVGSSGRQSANWYARPDTNKIQSWNVTDWAWVSTP